MAYARNAFAIPRKKRVMMNQKKASAFRHQSVWAMIAISALAIAVYIFRLTPADHNHKPLNPPEKITIAYSATTDAALAEVAQAQGYYLEEGLVATPHRHPYGKLALREVLDGKADFATVAETPVMFAIMKGEKISVIASIQSANKSNAIVARRDKGILTPNDLKGRKIAVTMGTTSHFFMDTFLSVQGISRKDVKVIDLKPGELRSALIQGDIDAASVFNPYVIQLQGQLGNRGVTFYDENIYTQTFNIVATQEYIRINPEKVKKMLRALIRAEEFISQNPAEAQKIVSDFSRIDRNLVREISAVTTFSVGLDQSLLLALEDESEWAMKNKLTDQTQMPNYLDFIYFEGLESVKAEAVRILR
jgi:NitT/TauT family transport system substrate-binding protein